MANIPNPHHYQTRANKLISTAIEELVGKASDEAFGEYGGRLVRFDHRWHPMDLSPDTIETAIPSTPGATGGS